MQNMRKNKVLLAGGTLIATLFLSGTAGATQAVWDASFTPAGWTRGSTTGSRYAEWNVFTDDANASLIVDQTPEVSNFGGGTYQLTETSGTAFLTSGGNIYSFAAPTGFTFSASGSSDTGTRDVYLRVGSVGNVVSNRSFTGFTLNGIAGTYSELYSETVTGGFGGSEIEALLFWNDIANASTFNFAWNAVGSSVSLDQLSLDISPVTAVPVPAALWLLGSALTGLMTIGRRQSARA
jgi:hypothetical protein